jgi:hypothetical protein
MSTHAPYTICDGAGSIIATALHHGHELRPEVAQRIKLSDHERLREEDPFTGQWTSVVPNQVVVHRSRFEVDLNRPLEKAVYVRPEDAWGLEVWKSTLPRPVLDRSRAIHAQFYRDMFRLLTTLTQQNERVVVLDIHSYNHRRSGCDALPADPCAHPDVNLGTGTLNRRLWGSVVDRFAADLGACPVAGRRLDVRENVVFRGGNWPRWVHETFPENVCAIAIEFKKFFMDEWTGQPYDEIMVDIRAALNLAAQGVAHELERLNVVSP